LRFGEGYARGVVETGRTYELPTGSKIKVTGNPRENGGKLLAFERTMPPGKGKAEPHLHQDCEQRYEFVSGTAQMDVDGEARTLAAGEKLTVPAGTTHRDPYNEGPGTLVFRTEIEPSPEFITAFGEAIIHMYERGGLNKRDDLPLLQIFVMVDAFDGKSYRAGIPVRLQTLVLPLVAAIGRLRGYHPAYGEPSG
jgi:mannose-6-phosphate isomerase-like protein (cupin superfamily)